ncbi:RHS repeat domain-containing protein, partial [Leptospira alstonii]|uniref:RHS repeat domain-containing protein n=1 Tax=Leptospira alstonii TaxID=28452 RepID=UPI000A583F90
VRIAALNEVGALAYFLTDQVDSVSHVLDDEGNSLSHIQFQPYGETFVQRGDSNFAPKFNAQELDRESGFFFFNARFYDPAIARFTSADTIIDGEFDTQGWNRFSYVKGNPIGAKDPTGHDAIEGFSPSKIGEHRLYEKGGGVADSKVGRQSTEHLGDLLLKDKGKVTPHKVVANKSGVFLMDKSGSHIVQELKPKDAEKVLNLAFEKGSKHTKDLLKNVDIANKKDIAKYVKGLKNSSLSDDLLKTATKSGKGVLKNAGKLGKAALPAIGVAADLFLTDELSPVTKNTRAGASIGLREKDNVVIDPVGNQTANPHDINATLSQRRGTLGIKEINITDK